MAIHGRFIQVTTLFVLLTSFSAYAQQTLTIEQAVKTAIERDALINMYQSRSHAYREQSIEEDTLPDPKIKFGFLNFPTDTFARNQEPMTQIKLGVQQMFPRGSSLEIKSQRAMNMSMAESAKTEDQRRKVTHQVRDTWLELFYWLKAQDVVSKNRNLFSKLVSVTKQQYAAGRQKQQDVIRSELELGMLDDRELKIETKLEVTRAKLEKYIGDGFSMSTLSPLLPQFNTIQNNASWIEKHPMIKMEDAMVSVKEKNIDLAKQSYKPSWMLDLSYGQREDDGKTGKPRPDFVTAMVVFDLPLFTADKQDKKVAASKYRLNGALNAREERKRQLKRMWESNLAKEKRLSQRIEKYKNLLIPKAIENTKAALYSYQSGQGAFTALMRAQIIELETQLRALRLNVDYKKTQAQLLYFVGEV